MKNTIGLILVLFLVIVNNQSSIAQSLNGSYTVGGDIPDYTTINDAVDDLILNGVDGQVTFNINPGTYNENIILPYIEGVDSINTINFQSTDLDSSSVIITSENDVFYLTNTSYISITNVTIIPVDGARGIYILQGSNLIISNNLFSSDDNCDFIKLADGNTILLSNNRFVDGFNQINIDGNNSTSVYDIDILYNEFEGDSYRKIYSHVASSVIIAGNVFRGSCSYQICDLTSYTDINILNNKFLIQDSYLDLSISPQQKILFKNNFVTSSVRISNSDSIIITHNSFNTSNTNMTFWAMDEGDYIEMHNNIFQSLGNDHILKFNFNTSLIDIISDHNIFNIENEIIAREQIQYQSEYIEYSLDDWQGATNQDTNSIFANITYLSDEDLHTNSPISLNSGIYIAGEDFDIDNELRDTLQPNIGADEYEIDLLIYVDLKLEVLTPLTESTCINSDSIAIKIINISSIAIDSFYVKWNLFDTEMQELFFLHNIAPLDTTVLFIDTYNFRQRSNYNISAEVYLPNGVIDANINDNVHTIDYSYVNDFSIKKNINVYCDSDLELFVPIFPRQAILWSTGSTDGRIFVTTPGIYSVTITDINGCVSDQLIEIN